MDIHSKLNYKQQVHKMNTIYNLYYILLIDLSPSVYVIPMDDLRNIFLLIPNQTFYFTNVCKYKNIKIKLYIP